ncbi:hypothetical protein HDV00_011971 [Rhizophlyctis rosea]|nr:hypothetical protein HDV00_011971 [Rhizophlyctis rosea]
MPPTPRIHPLHFTKFYRQTHKPRPPPPQIHSFEQYYKYGDCTIQEFDSKHDARVYLHDYIREHDREVKDEELGGMTFKQLAEEAVEVGEGVVERREGFGVRAAVLGRVVADFREGVSGT